MSEISWSEPAGMETFLLHRASVNGPNKDLTRPQQRRGGDYVKEERLYFQRTWKANERR